MSNAALLGAQFLAAIGPDERSGHSAQPPRAPEGPPGSGSGRRLLTVSWILVALMLGAIVALAAIG